MFNNVFLKLLQKSKNENNSKQISLNWHSKLMKKIDQEHAWNDLDFFERNIQHFLTTIVE